VAFRARIIGSLDDPLGVGAYWSWFNSQSEGEQSQIVAPILNKIRPWIVRSKLRHVLGQADPLLDLDEVLARNRILLAPLSAGDLGDDAASLLGAVLVSKIFGAIMRRVRMPQSQRRPVFLFIDEAQILGKLPTPLADMLAVARGMGVSVILGHQTLSQFDAELKSAILGAARSRVIFQTGAEDAARFARELTPYLGPDDLRGLAPFEIVAALSTGERVAPPATGRTRPLPPGNGQADRVRELSRQRWGRNRDEVEAEMRRRQERPTGSGPIGRQRRST
jgi:DNA helicase HerA-like ATPase